MNYLPLNLGTLANLAERDNGSRPGIAGIQLRTALDGTFTAAATDGRVALIVTGPQSTPGAIFPISAALAAAPNGELSALIPAVDWKREFAAAVKLTKKAPPPLRTLAVSIGKQLTTLAAASDTGATTFAQPRNIDACFPAVADVIPPTSKALATIQVDPRHLSRLLDAITAIIDADTPGINPAVTLEIHDGKISAVHAGPTADGIRVTGAFALVGEEKAKKGRRKPAPEVAAVLTDEIRQQLADYAANVKSADALVERPNTELAAARAAPAPAPAGRPAHTSWPEQRDLDAAKPRATDAEADLAETQRDFDAARAELAAANERITGLKASNAELRAWASHATTEAPVPAPAPYLPPAPQQRRRPAAGPADSPAVAAIAAELNRVMARNDASTPRAPVKIAGGPAPAPAPRQTVPPAWAFNV